MRVLILFLLAAIAASPVIAEKKKKESGFQKILRSMFPSAKPKVVKSKKKRSPPTKPKVIHKSTRVPVEIEWMARYWEQEAAWDYYIPEDDLIRFKDGKYIVPIVVYRHYEDMLNTPRKPTPAPVQIIIE